MKPKFLPLLLISLIILSCQGQQTKAIQTIEVKTFAEKLQSTKNPQLLDVRTPEEYNSEHINQAVNVNWFDTNFVNQAQKYDKSKPIFVYCKSGGRSMQASNKLSELGFKEIYNLDGGMMKWSAAGYSKPSGKVIGMTEKEYTTLTQSGEKVVIDFYAEWCAPCKKMKPYLTKMQAELKGKINITRIDADKNKTIIEKLKIDGLPVIIIYENGKEVYRHMGFLSEEDLRKELQ